MAYRVDLAPTTRAHNVFHVSALKAYHELDDASRKPARPPPVITADDGNDEWEVERILDVRTRGRQKKLQYLVLWKSYPLHEATWERAENLTNAREAVAGFEKSRFASLTTITKINVSRLARSFNLLDEASHLIQPLVHANSSFIVTVVLTLQAKRLSKLSNV